MLKRKFWQLVLKLSKKLFHMFKTSCFCNVLPSNHISGKGFSGIVLNLQQYPKIWDNDTDLVLIFSRFWYICDPFAHRIAFLCFFSFGMLPSIFGGPGPTIYSFINLARGFPVSNSQLELRHDTCTKKPSYGLVVKNI